MKKILLAVVLIASLQSCIVSSKPNMDFADNLGKPPKGTQIVSINPPMLLAKPFIIHALKEDKEDEEVLRLVRKIKKVRVMCVQIDSLSDNQTYRQAMSQQIDKFIRKKHYEEYATIRSKGQKVAIHARQDGDLIRELMIQTISPKDGEVYVHVKANISPEDLSRLINMANDN